MTFAIPTVPPTVPSGDAVPTGPSGSDGGEATTFEQLLTTSSEEATPTVPDEVAEPQGSEPPESPETDAADTTPLDGFAAPPEAPPATTPLPVFAFAPPPSLSALPGDVAADRSVLEAAGQTSVPALASFVRAAGTQTTQGADLPVPGANDVSATIPPAVDPATRPEAPGSGLTAPSSPPAGPANAPGAPEIEAPAPPPTPPTGNAGAAPVESSRGEELVQAPRPAAPASVPVTERSTGPDEPPAPSSSAPRDAATSAVAGGDAPVGHERDGGATAEDDRGARPGLKDSAPSRPESPTPAQPTQTPKIVQAATEPPVEAAPSASAPSASVAPTAPAASPAVEAAAPPAAVAAPGAPTSRTPSLESLVDQIRVQVKPGISRVSFAVDPPELGRVSVRLVLRAGRLTGQITAESGEIARVLDSGVEQLREAIRSAGIHVEDLEVRGAGQEGGPERDARSAAREEQAAGRRDSGSPETEERNNPAGSSPEDADVTNETGRLDLIA